MKQTADYSNTRALLNTIRRVRDLTDETLSESRKLIYACKYDDIYNEELSYAEEQAQGKFEEVCEHIFQVSELKMDACRRIAHALRPYLKN